MSKQVICNLPRIPSSVFFDSNIINRYHFDSGTGYFIWEDSMNTIFKKGVKNPHFFRNAPQLGKLHTPYDPMAQQSSKSTRGKYLLAYMAGFFSSVALTHGKNVAEHLENNNRSSENSVNREEQPKYDNNMLKGSLPY